MAGSFLQAKLPSNAFDYVLLGTTAERPTLVSFHPPVALVGGHAQQYPHR
jgi:hypothetical protein